MNLDSQSANSVRGPKRRGRRAAVLWLTAVSLIATCGPALAKGRPLLLISIDGLRPDYVARAGEHGLKVPHLRSLLHSGVYATGVRGVLPTSTYPSHTTILTGVSPAGHGIVGNKPFDPALSDPNRWFWFAEDVRVPTLWRAAADGGKKVASVGWPVSVGEPAIHFNIPEYAGSRTADDLKAVRGFATPGLMDELRAAAGDYIVDVHQALPRDWARTRYTVELIRRKRPDFVTVHLAAPDNRQHASGPFSAEAIAAIEEVDRMVQELTLAMRTRNPDAIVCIVSDHGFAAVDRVLKLDAAFVRAGLITLKSSQESLHASGIADWIAMPWPAGGSAAVFLKQPDHEPGRRKVREVLETLAADPANGIARILDRHSIAKAGGDPKAEFWVDMEPGWILSGSLLGPVAGAIGPRGTHGYAPEHAEMNATFILAGGGVRKNVELGVIDMRSIAPTLARAMGLSLASAELPPLDVFEPGRRPAASPKAKREVSAREGAAKLFRPPVRSPDAAQAIDSQTQPRSP